MDIYLHDYLAVIPAPNPEQLSTAKQLSKLHKLTSNLQIKISCFPEIVIIRPENWSALRSFNQLKNELSRKEGILRSIFLTKPQLHTTGYESFKKLKNCVIEISVTDNVKMNKMRFVAHATKQSKFSNKQQKQHKI